MNRWRGSSWPAWAPGRGPKCGFSPTALRPLLQYSWPGNVRELENALEYGVAVCKGQTILPEDLPAELDAAAVPLIAAHGPAAAGHDAVHLREALNACHWNRGDTARALGVSRTTLWRLMREYGLTHPSTEPSR